MPEKYSEYYRYILSVREKYEIFITFFEFSSQYLWCIGVCAWEVFMIQIKFSWWYLWCIGGLKISVSTWCAKAISVKSENILLNKGCGPPEPEVRVHPWGSLTRTTSSCVSPSEVVDYCITFVFCLYLFKSFWVSHSEFVGHFWWPWPSSSNTSKSKIFIRQFSPLGIVNQPQYFCLI